MKTPTKLSHIVLQTNQPAALRDWYCRVLGATVVHENDFICFISYDDEHHRLAFVNPGALAARQPGQGGDLRAGTEAGLHHMAFTFGSLGDLLDTFSRLKDAGIRPFWCINHGPTTSMYFRDPDNNQVELQIDNFERLADAKAYMQSEAFARNPIGVEFDPEALLARLKSGARVEELVRLG